MKKEVKLKKKSCWALIKGYRRLAEKVAEVRQNGFSLRFLAAGMATNNYRTVYNRLLEADPSIEGGCGKGGRPPKEESELVEEWRENNPALSNAMMDRKITPRQWLAAYGYMIRFTGRVDIYALTDPVEQTSDFGIGITRQLHIDFPEAYGDDQRLGFYNFAAIHGVDYWTKGSRKFLNVICYVLKNDELGVKVSTPSYGKAMERCKERIYQEVIIRRMEMILATSDDEDSIDKNVVNQALHWLPRKASSIQKEKVSRRGERDSEIRLLLGERDYVKDLRLTWRRLNANIHKGAKEIQQMQDINHRLEAMGMIREMGKREQYKCSAEIPRPHYQHREIDDFWVKYLATGKYTLEKATIQATQEILFLLDAEGDCPSVVDQFDFVKDQFGDKSSYDLVKQVPLWRHTLNVAELMATPQKDDYVQDIFNAMVIHYILIGLIHDLGKLPSTHGEFYASGDHPIIFQLALQEVTTFMTLYNYDYYAMPVKGHHAPGGNDLTKLLKGADSEARKIEFCEATKKK